MMDYNKYIKDIVTECKGLNIIVNNDANQQVGVLKPITRSLLNDTEAIAKITKWRNQAKRHFLTQFTATEERTKKWLEDIVLTDHSRLLFLIYSPAKLVGQYGFKGLSNTTVEIDNIIRGEIGGDPRLIYYSEIALINWLFRTFDIESVFGIVFAENLITLDLHASVGFCQTELIPLQKIERNGEVFFRMGNAASPSNDKLYAQKIEIRRKEFIFVGG